MTDAIPKDCRVIAGDLPVIISRDTAIWALEAVRAHYTAERKSRLFADDRSFLRAAVMELEKAAAAKTSEETKEAQELMEHLRDAYQRLPAADRPAFETWVLMTLRRK